MKRVRNLLFLTLTLGFLPLIQTSEAQQVCQVFCVTSPCSSNSDCTAAPNGRCNFACPHTGCCVYN
jgi:hypothetical protein